MGAPPPLEGHNLTRTPSPPTTTHEITSTTSSTSASNAAPLEEPAVTHNGSDRKAVERWKSKLRYESLITLANLVLVALVVAGLGYWRHSQEPTHDESNEALISVERGQREASGAARGGSRGGRCSNVVAPPFDRAAAPPVV